LAKLSISHVVRFTTTKGANGISVLFKNFRRVNFYGNGEVTTEYIEPRFLDDYINLALTELTPKEQREVKIKC